MLAMPLFAHCDCTAAGSTGLSLLTQAGISPQQLPTFFTAQSALVLQLLSIFGASLTNVGGKGRDICGGGLACVVRAGASVVTGAAQAESSDNDSARHRLVTPWRKKRLAMFILLFVPRYRARSRRD
ncbi:MAG: hypothetical protein ACOH1R_07190 [Luteimonas sp.]